LGLWISCTLTNKKTNYFSKQTYHKNQEKKTKKKQKKKSKTKNYLAKENKQKEIKHPKEKKKKLSFIFARELASPSSNFFPTRKGVSHDMNFHASFIGNHLS
jgi:hypothetical protein